MFLKGFEVMFSFFFFMKGYPAKPIIVVSHVVKVKLRRPTEEKQLCINLCKSRTFIDRLLAFLSSAVVGVVFGSYNVKRKPNLITVFYVQHIRLLHLQ